MYALKAATKTNLNGECTLINMHKAYSYKSRNSNFVKFVFPDQDCKSLICGNNSSLLRIVDFFPVIDKCLIIILYRAQNQKPEANPVKV